MPKKGRLKQQLKRLDRTISFYIDKTNKSREETAYLHELLHKRHDYMLMHFYAKESHLRFVPEGMEVVDIILDKPLMHNQHLESLDDSAPDAFILLEDHRGNKAVMVHELKCGRSKRVIQKGIQQLDKYAREVGKNFDTVICLLTFGKRTKEVKLESAVPLQTKYFGRGFGAMEI